MTGALVLALLAAQTGAVAAPDAGGALNPKMSVIVDGSFGYYGRRPSDFTGLGLPAAGDDPSPSKEGFTLQEMELSFQTAIDPYLDGAAFVTIPNLSGLEIEEAYLVTSALPWNLQVKAGSFRSQVGRNNTQHLHLQNFTRRPLMTALLFGADGFRGPGAQASVLFPGLPWFATLYLEALSVDTSENTGVATFDDGPHGPSRLAYTAVLEQFWPVTEAVSLQLGLNGATAVTSGCALSPCADGRRDYLYGGDLYLKWRPPTALGEHLSVSWATEYFARSISQGGPTEGALYTEPMVQVARRWYLAARLDVTGLPAGDDVPRRTGVAGSVTCAPTEFSRFRLYGQRLHGAGLPDALVGFVQMEFSMGAHGAHPF